jgi:hypothetical protein
MDHYSCLFLKYLFPATFRNALRKFVRVSATPCFLRPPHSFRPNISGVQLKHTDIAFIYKYYKSRLISPEVRNTYGHSSTIFTLSLTLNNDKISLSIEKAGNIIRVCT